MVNSSNALMAREGQTLENHSERVSNLASKFGKKNEIANIMYIVGFLHDLGKKRPEFQSYLMDSIAGKAVQRGSVVHSIFGAKRIFVDTEVAPHLAEILANVIAAHHGYLYDNLSSDGDTPLLTKLLETELLDPMPNSPIINTATIASEFKGIFEKIHDEDGFFGLSMLTKLIFSCLVDADRLDAYLHESGTDYTEKLPDWNNMLASLMKHLASKANASEMGIFRQKISDSCGKAGARDKGIYKLEVPTGGGKTLASLRFALTHAKQHGLDRVIYIIPYLSILSQTAKEIREALNADEFTVLEHHSGFLPDDSTFYKLNTDRWDAPIILTSQVQLLETIFSAKGSDLRKFHNMSNSVLIFDEVQSLPVKCVHLFNGAMNFLSDVCGSTILLCTATQPLLDAVDRKLRFSEDPSIVQCEPLSKRTNIVNATKPGGYSFADLSDFVMDKHNSSTLVIVNTKSAAKSLYEELSQSKLPILHLSTNMCGAHRDNVIAELKRKLDAKEPVICISTQLIEAGVDISLECVIRDVAGLDSIFQAAGRCNRHGEFGEAKDVYVVNIANQNLNKLPDIKEGAEITQLLFNQGRGDDIDGYYKQYFFDRKGDMDYKTADNGSIYDLLSTNQQGRNAYINLGKSKTHKVPKMLSAIRSASDAFYVIDKGRKDVIVPYGDALDLVERYCKAYALSEKRKLLRKLGKYSVSLYHYQEEALQNAGALYPQGEQGELTVLEEGFYDSVRGLDLDGKHEFLNS